MGAWIYNRTQNLDDHAHRRSPRTQQTLSTETFSWHQYSIAAMASVSSILYFNWHTCILFTSIVAPTSVELGLNHPLTMNPPFSFICWHISITAVSSAKGSNSVEFGDNSCLCAVTKISVTLFDVSDTVLTFSRGAYSILSITIERTHFFFDATGKQPQFCRTDCASQNLPGYTLSVAVADFMRIVVDTNSK